jgi:hypothetical protein
MRFTYLWERNRGETHLCLSVARRIDGVSLIPSTRPQKESTLTTDPSVAASPSTMGIAKAAPALAPANNEAGMR